MRSALEKLRLNDAALSFEPETSVALGYGFRCGFLGLLHMEIIQERLEREFDLDLVTTAPSVVYHVIKTDGEKVTIDNPTNLPPATEIAYMEEPMVAAQVITPQEYVGAIMELCQDKRGTFKDMKYIEGNRVLLTYDLPLNEVIYDFFDQLKSRTRGYASFDYELNGYVKSDLVKLEILLNGEQCDALAIIVHRDRAYARGRSIAEKLKEVIPRQLFEIPIQAAVGGKRDRARNGQGPTQGCARQVLWRRYHAQKEAAGKAEGRQKAHAPGGHGRGAQRGVHGGFEDGLTGFGWIEKDLEHERRIHSHSVLRAQVRVLRFCLVAGAASGLAAVCARRGRRNSRGGRRAG